MLKKYLGSPGVGNEWHHIVEQRASNISAFGSEAIHNVDNSIAINSKIHTKISAFYSSKQRFTNGLRVREWLKGQSFQKQYEFGIKVLRDFGVIK